jgi:hypothetical protein
MMDEAEANILSLAVTEVKMTLPFVCEATFSNSAGSWYSMTRPA